MFNIFQWSEPQIYAFFFVLVRVSGMMAFLPIFGDRTIPPVIRILFGVALSFVVFPFAWGSGSRIDPAILDSTSRTIWAICCDMGFGMMVGYVARWVFDAAQGAGNLAGAAMGLTMASVVDPHTEQQTLAMAELHYILAVMLFLGLNGHHIYLEAMLQSFKIAPIGGVNLLANGSGVVEYLISMTGEVLLLAVKLAAPVIVVLLLLNLAFGIVAKAVPQMNVFVVSFSVNIIVGLFVMLVSFPGFVNMVSGAFDTYTPELFRFMRLFGG